MLLRIYLKMTANPIVIFLFLSYTIAYEIFIFIFLANFFFIKFIFRGSKIYFIAPVEKAGLILRCRGFFTIDFRHGLLIKQKKDSSSRSD